MCACICKWHGSSVRFILCIKDTRDDAIALEYEIPFARIEYCGPDRFLCAYMRHTGEWFDMCFGQPESLTECLRMVAEDTHFDVSFIAYS